MTYPMDSCEKVIACHLPSALGRQAILLGVNSFHPYTLLSEPLMAMAEPLC
ncbi:hypothetical protein [Aneurinibacillus migulanus]|uniref:hypothetical protein n=1 Tax=Aneurinibacillus migulanus TaxID=47500 RepID=UPI0014776D47|nr:hypothetical protein [Aneurinibacillus migulanus]